MVAVMKYLEPQKKIAEKVKLGQINTDDISAELFSNNLDTYDLPDPDLVIRTSGEMRTSNFLPWQCAYSEYVFEQSNWPDFNKDIYQKILNDFKNRERRFGAVLK